MSETDSSFSRRDFALCTSGLMVLLGAAGAESFLNRVSDDPAALDAATARLESIPARIGNWTSAPERIDPGEKYLTEIAGGIRRTYCNSDDDSVVSMTILCGASGPLSLHPATACFESVGYELVSGPTVIALADGGSQSTLNRAAFRIPGSPLSDIVRVFWGWSDNGTWTAPANPRSAFRGEDCLYKLYVVDRSLPQTEDTRQSETFLEEALPVIRRRLQKQ